MNPFVVIWSLCALATLFYVRKKTGVDCAPTFWKFLIVSALWPLLFLYVFFEGEL